MNPKKEIYATIFIILIKMERRAARSYLTARKNLNRVIEDMIEELNKSNSMESDTLRGLINEFSSTTEEENAALIFAARKKLSDVFTLETLFEWQEENGLLPAGSSGTSQAQGNRIEIENYSERYLLTLDNTQSAVNNDVAYRYVNDEYRLEASKNGTFPRVLLLSPTHEAIILAENESKTYGQGNGENYSYLKTSVDGPVAGEWYLLFENFKNIEKSISVTLDSGNATSYLHNGSTGTIDIYYDGSDKPHDISVTWENTDRAAKDIKITAPDGAMYSKEQTPGNVMNNEYGRYMVKLPVLIEGNYHFEIKGEGLGRVWINSEESVALNMSVSMDTTEASEETQAPESDDTIAPAH